MKVIFIIYFLLFTSCSSNKINSAFTYTIEIEIENVKMDKSMKLPYKFLSHKNFLLETFLTNTFIDTSSINLPIIRFDTLGFCLINFNTKKACYFTYNFHQIVVDSISTSLNYKNKGFPLDFENKLDIPKQMLDTKFLKDTIFSNYEFKYFAFKNLEGKDKNKEGLMFFNKGINYPIHFDTVFLKSSLAYFGVVSYDSITRLKTSLIPSEIRKANYNENKLMSKLILLSGF